MAKTTGRILAGNTNHLPKTRMSERELPWPCRNEKHSFKIGHLRQRNRASNFWSSSQKEAYD